VGTVNKIKRKPKRQGNAEKTQVLACDLFAGAGGFSLGAYLAGITVAAAVEWDQYACQTYRNNLHRAATRRVQQGAMRVDLAPQQFR
jgi:DNA (cytosine-5)-methyltransferase 1